MNDMPVENGGIDDPIYNHSYYRDYCGGIPYSRDEPHWMQFFGGVAEKIIQYVHPKSVFDLGCAKGFLVEALRDCGVEAYGSDISKYAISQVRADLQPFCKVASVTDALDRDYDVITCIEVLEHVTEEDAKVAIANMAARTENIIFSSTPSDFDEPTHINVQPVLYWLEQFAERGFCPDLSRDADFITSWAVFLKKGCPAKSDVVGYVARMVDLKMELNKKNQRLAELEGFVQTQQQLILGHEAQSRRLQDTLHTIRTVTGWRWLKGAYRRLRR